MNIRISAAAAAAALVLAGCGSSTGGSGSSSGSSAARSSASSSAATSADNSTLAPKALSDAALAAVKAAKSFHVSADGTSDGQRLMIDMSYSDRSSTGSITIADSKIELRNVDGQVYFTAPDAFWRKQAGAQADVVLPLVSGKWVLVPAGNKDFAELASFADRDQFVGSLNSDSTGHAYASVPGRTIDGIETVGIRDTTDGSVLYVAKNGTPYPVQGESKDTSGSGGGTFAFGGWNAPVEVTAPPAGDVIDLSRLK